MARKEISKIGLELKILCSKVHFLCLKQLNPSNIAPDIFKCRPGKYREVVREKISGSNSLQSPNNLAQKRSSGVANCWFECVGAFLNRRLFVSE